MIRTAIVTGASSGIGRAIATAFINEGINVALVARNMEKLTVFEQKLNGPSPKATALAIQADVSKREQIEAMVKTVEAKLGAINFAVNNAGVMHDSQITKGEIDQWEEMIDVNVKGILYLLNEVVPRMVAQKYGHIINIGSVSGVEVTNKSTVYSATKFAVRALSIGLEKELARTGVRVTNISPGMVDTNLVERGPLDRTILAADDIAEAAVFAINQPEHVNVNEITIRPV